MEILSFSVLVIGTGYANNFLLIVSKVLKNTCDKPSYPSTLTDFLSEIIS